MVTNRKDPMWSAAQLEESLEGNWMPAGIEFALLGSLRSAWSPQSSPDYLRLAWSLYYPARILWGRRAWSPQSSPRLASLPQASSDLILVLVLPSRWKNGLDAMQLPTWSWLLQKSKWTCEIESWHWCFYLLPFFMFLVVKSKKWEILFLNFNLVVVAEVKSPCWS